MSEKNIRSIIQSSSTIHSQGNFMERAMGCIKNLCAGQALRFSSHLYLTRCMIIVRLTHIIKKGEIYQKPKTLIVWVGET